MQTIMVLYVFTGLLCVVLGIPLAGKRIPPNLWYGFRIPKTLKAGNEHIWYEANAYGGRLLVRSGLLIAAGTMMLRGVGGLTEDQYALGCLAITVGVLAVMTVLSYRYTAGL